MIQGNFKIVDAQGNEYSVEGDVVTLCRCGQSDNKPFCDGTHRPAGFEADSEAR
jgi:CDGSH-type Zn-finger protein